MKAVSGDLPNADGEWVYEIKWDGMRVIAFCDDDGVRLASSNGNDVTAAFPELAALCEVAEGFESIILDGEVVAFGDDGLPKFNILQHRMHVQDPIEAAKRSHDVPITFAIFDLLGVNGTDTAELALSDRRKLLEGIVDAGSHWRLTDQTMAEPNRLLSSVTERGMEGIIAKRLGSTYEPGKRSRSWIKIKPTLRQEFVVAGWTEGKDGLSGGLGSLVLAVANGGAEHELGFIPCGTVGSGLTNADRRWWQEHLGQDAVDESPLTSQVSYGGRAVRWAEPRRVVEVAFGEWTDDGRLRHPVYLGRRNDKDPAEVLREV